MSDSIVIKAQCLCKKHTFSAAVPKSTLPLEASCCHCSSCRHLTGGLYSVCVKWPSPSEDLSGLEKYSFSRNTDIFSCGTCSSQLFCRSTAHTEVPFVVTGALENTPGLVKYNSHMFVGDTIDGGASIWLPRHEYGKPAKRWREHRNESEELPMDWPAPNATPASRHNTKASTGLTTFHCHCKGVKLSLRSAVDLELDPTKEVYSWCIEPKTLRFKASTDACNSCRISFGSDLPGWTFAPLSHISFDTESVSNPSEFPQTLGALREAVISEKKDPRLGSLAIYKSSPDVERYFCSTCSASVFYAVDDRDGMVDIAVGLLDHPDGARAEGLLAWSYGKVGWEADASGGWREQLVASTKSLQTQWVDLVGEGKTSSD